MGVQLHRLFPHRAAAYLTREMRPQSGDATVDAAFKLKFGRFVSTKHFPNPKSLHIANSLSQFKHAESIIKAR